MEDAREWEVKNLMITGSYVSVGLFSVINAVRIGENKVISVVRSATQPHKNCTQQRAIKNVYLDRSRNRKKRIARRG